MTSKKQADEMFEAADKAIRVIGVYVAKYPMITGFPMLVATLALMVGRTIGATAKNSKDAEYMLEQFMDNVRAHAKNVMKNEVQ